MRIANIIGKVTLNRVHPSLASARWLIGVPHSLQALKDQQGGDGEPWVVFDELGAGQGSMVAVSEGAEAAAPFYPGKKPVDAYCACILDQVTIAESEN